MRAPEGEADLSPLRVGFDRRLRRCLHDQGAFRTISLQ